MRPCVTAVLLGALVVAACASSDTDDAAFCELLDTNLQPFEVGQTIDLDSAREIVAAAPDGLRDDFSVYLALAEEIDQLDLTDQDDAAEMLRRLAEPDAVEAEQNIVSFRVESCDARGTDPAVDGD